MKKRPQEEGGGDSWMNTYSDMVTLLLCFFVLLLSFSEVNAEKWEQFVKAFMHPGNDTAQIVVVDPDRIEPGDGPIPNDNNGQQTQDGMTPSTENSSLPEDFDDLFLYLQAYIEENNLSSSVEVSTDGENVVYIRFQNNIFFRPDKYDLLPSAYEILGFVGDCLHNVEEQIYIISINGHTADVEQDNYAVSDWMLSSERASNVAIYLEEQRQISPQKLRPMGYGKNYPVAPNDTEEGREKNRRVDITIIRDTGEGTNDSVNDELASLFDPSQFPKSGGALDVLSPEEGTQEPTEPLDTPETQGSPETPQVPEETPVSPDPTGNS